MYGTILRWFYKQEQAKQLTGTAQRLWCWLYDHLGMAHANHFYEISSKALAQELGVCLKSVERSRKALQNAGFLRYEVRGKSIYYMLLLPESFTQSAEITISAETQQSKEIISSVEKYLSSYENLQVCDKNANYLELSQSDTAILLQQLVSQLQKYTLIIHQLQTKLNQQQHMTDPGIDDNYLQDTTVNSAETTITDLQEPHANSLHDQVKMKILESRQFIDKPDLEILPVQPLQIDNSKEYCTYKDQEKRKRSSDILFNDKYEILLWRYLDKYRDNRFSEACYNHFFMIKELYKNKSKKALTEFGFYNIMEHLEQISGNDMTLKLAIMERSLRNSWVGFFTLPENTPEYKKTEKKKQGRKRASYRNNYNNEKKQAYKSKFKPEGRDLSFLEE